MTTKPIEQPEPTEDRNALLEKALIEEYLQEKGYSHEDLKTMPADVVEKLMKEASQYASLKMEEVSARAHLIKELHDDASSLEK
jgi:predicted transcriptional regulator